MRATNLAQDHHSYLTENVFEMAVRCLIKLKFLVKGNPNRPKLLNFLTYLTARVGLVTALPITSGWNYMERASFSNKKSKAWKGVLFNH